MKKIKFMLVSLALFAVVGGALAFKAKFNTLWCYAPTVSGICPAQKCPFLVDHAKTTIVDAVRACTTTAVFSAVDQTFTCPNNCIVLTTITSDGAGALTFTAIQ